MLCNRSITTAHARRVAARHVVAFTCIVRDGETYLARNLEAILSLGRAFLRARLFYVENDSTDGTRQILHEYGRRNPGAVHGRMLDNASGVFSRALCPAQRATSEINNCKKRTSLLSRLRQEVLALALAWHEWHALIALDLDFVAFSAADYLASFARAIDLNASAIFASSVVQNTRGHLVLYDKSALRFPKAGKSAAKQAMTAWKAGCLVPVLSAFGGFGTYMAGPLRASAASYSGEDGGTNEHLALNMVISNLKGGAPPVSPRVYLDPGFRPEYEWGGDEFWVAFCAQAMARRKAQHGPRYAWTEGERASADDAARRQARQVRGQCLHRWPASATNSSWIHPSWVPRPGERWEYLGFGMWVPATNCSAAKRCVAAPPRERRRRGGGGPRRNNA